MAGCLEGKALKALVGDEKAGTRRGPLGGLSIEKGLLASAVGVVMVVVVVVAGSGLSTGTTANGCRLRSAAVNGEGEAAFAAACFESKALRGLVGEKEVGRRGPVGGLVNEKGS